MRGRTDEEGLALHVLEALHVLVRDQHLRVFLERRCHGHHRHACVTGDQHGKVGAHHAVGLTGGHHLQAVELRAAHLDGDIEAVFLVQAGGHRLVEAAVLGLRVPVGLIDKLFLCVGGVEQNAKGQSGDGGPGDGGGKWISERAGKQFHG